jgi:NAD(P)-dependent dehydrogenase (short-subunit alcohol dehydrogenase family)
MELGLSGKTVLITGGSKGIGLACAEVFLAEGCTVILVARDAERLQQARHGLAAQGRVITRASDLSEPAERTALFAAHPEIDILVNNAGAIPGGGLLDLSMQTWEAAWALKVMGYIHLTQLYLATMKQRGGGVICNVIGAAGRNPRYDYICGGAGNAALMAFTQGVGATSHKNGIRVFGINPSPTRSDRMENMMKNNAKNKLGDENRWTELTQKLPFGRMTEPSEIANLTVFCSSPLCGYLSGSVINVDGGQMFAPV